MAVLDTGFADMKTVVTLQDGDLIHVMVRDEDLAKVEATLGKSPEA